MVQVSDEQFRELVKIAVAEIPERFAAHLNNVAFLVAEEPTAEQLGAGRRLHAGEMLLGLYEGIPLPSRNNGYNMVLPDVITVFKRAHEVIATDLDAMRRDVHQTVWHEVAHYFGLDHGQIGRLER